MTNKADIEVHKKTLDEFAGIVVEEQASDLHINAFYKPVIRVSGSLLPLTNYEELTHEDSAEFLALMLNEEQRESFDAPKEIDF